MILAKCFNNDCVENANEYLVDDENGRVECGLCGHDCNVADPELGFVEPDLAAQAEEYNYQLIQEPIE